MHANSRQEIRHCLQIAAAVGLKDTGNQTHWQMKKQIILSQSTFQNQLSTDGCQNLKLTKIRWVSPFLKNWPKKTQHSALKQTLKSETVISGMGESFTWTSLLTVCRVQSGSERCSFGDLTGGNIPRFYQARGFFKRQSGGKGQFGDVWIRLTPNEEGKAPIRKRERRWWFPVNLSQRLKSSRIGG